MSVIEELLESVGTHIGHENTRVLGPVTDVMIRRYARAIGESNPLYFDSEFARGRGFTDIIAPPNMITAIVGWFEGPPPDSLREDGCPKEPQIAWLPTSGVRVMGGGEDMEFHTPVTAGTTVVEKWTLVGVDLRRGKKGPVLVVTYNYEFTDEAGLPLVTSTRKVLVR